MLSHVLGFDGGIGARSEIVDGRYTGRDDGPFTYREGKAERMRELADERGHRPRRLVRLLGLGVRPADAARCRAPGRRQPRRRARPDRARRRAGRSCASSSSDAACSRPSRWSAWASSGPPGARRGGAPQRRGGALMSLHDLTDEQRDIRELARRFADEVVAPQAAAWDREHRFPQEVLTQLGELGLLGVCIPRGARRRRRGLRRLHARDRGALARGRRARRRRSACTSARRRCRSSPTARRSRPSDSSRRWRRATSSGRSR